MTKSLTGAIVAAVVLFPIVTPTTFAQTLIGELKHSRNLTTIFGQVIGISGDEFMLDDGTGQILVDTDDGKLTNLFVGEQIIVAGRYDDDDFDAVSITRQDGTIIDLRLSLYDDDDDDDDDDYDDDDD